MRRRTMPPDSSRHSTERLVTSGSTLRRWVTVPSWLRVLLPLRGMLGSLFDAASRHHAAEIDARLERDVAERGVEEASALVGAGGAADRSR